MSVDINAKIQAIKESAITQEKTTEETFTAQINIEPKINNSLGLNEILKKVKKFNKFTSIYNKTMGGAYKETADYLSVFYEHNILSTLKENGTSIKSENGLYYIWTGKYWKSLDQNALKRFIKEFIKKRGTMAHRSSSVVDGTFKNIAITTGGITIKRDENLQLLNLNNGVLLISKGKIEFKEHNKKFNLNYCLNFDYNPKAVNHKWQSFLDDVLPNKDTQKTLQQIIGNLLIRGLKIEVLPFLYGTGGNGKSVVLEVLTGLFGTDNITTYSLTKITTDEKVRARIADGKIMNLSSENNMGNINVEVAKAYSSSEPLDARLNYGNPFEIYQYAKFLGNVNKLTVMDGERTNAIARRQIIIPFVKNIHTDKSISLDIDLHNKILKDKSGVLNWILQGISEVLKNRSIFKSQEVLKLLKKYREDTNPVHQMIDEREYNIITDGSCPKTHFATLKELYDEYTSFVTEVGVGKLSRSNFKADLLTIDGIREFSSQNKTCFNLSKIYKNKEDDISEIF